MRILPPLALALAVAFAILATPAIAENAPQPAPDPARLKATVEKLVGFGTRHTLSSTDDPIRGIGAARAWVGGEMTRIADACDGCILVANIARTFTGPLAPAGVNVVDVLGFQQGLDPRRVVIVGAHIDSRIADARDATHDAPGANDDGSGVALVLEAARILSREKFRATIVYAVFSGTGQGLFGSQLLADTARQRRWTVSAMLDNDRVGSTVGQDPVRDVQRVQVSFAGLRTTSDLSAQIARRGDTGAQWPSRSLATVVGSVAEAVPGGLSVVRAPKPDRTGSDGDDEPFANLGYPAVRLSAEGEDRTTPQQGVYILYADTIDKIDFAYLAKVTALNVATIRRLASAPASPDLVTVTGAPGFDATVRWKPVAGAVAYRVHWHRSDAPDWQKSTDIPGSATSTLLKGVALNDTVIGVGAVATDGSESLVALAGPEPRAE